MTVFSFVCSSLASFGQLRGFTQPTAEDQQHNAMMEAGDLEISDDEFWGTPCGPENSTPQLKTSHLSSGTNASKKNRTDSSSYSSAADALDLGALKISDGPAAAASFTGSCRPDRRRQSSVHCIVPSHARSGSADHRFLGDRYTGLPQQRLDTSMHPLSEVSHSTGNVNLGGNPSTCTSHGVTSHETLQSTPQPTALPTPENSDSASSPPASSTPPDAAAISAPSHSTPQSEIASLKMEDNHQHQPDSVLQRSPPVQPEMAKIPTPTAPDLSPQQPPMTKYETTPTALTPPAKQEDLQQQQKHAAGEQHCPSIPAALAGSSTVAGRSFTLLQTPTSEVELRRSASRHPLAPAEPTPEPAAPPVKEEELEGHAPATGSQSLSTMFRARAELPPVAKRAIKGDTAPAASTDKQQRQPSASPVGNLPPNAPVRQSVPAATLPQATPPAHSPSPPPQPPQPDPVGPLTWEDEAKGLSFCLPEEMHRRLYVHQVEAMQWMWGLWRVGRGGILGDDMGLGKTLTCAAFLAGLQAPRSSPTAAPTRIRRALIIAPTSLLEHWAAELRVVGLTAMVYHGTKPQRAKLLFRIFQGHRVVITTYETALKDVKELSTPPCAHQIFAEDRDRSVPLWDAVLLDESHRAKNPKTKLYGALQQLRARTRILVTGTPVQNNLLELHALFDLACPGLLGDRRHFNRRFAGAIESSQDRYADSTQINIGAQRARELRELTAPHLLRREKRTTRMVTVAAANIAAAAGEHPAGPAGQAGAAGATAEGPVAGKQLPEKTDVVLWLTLHPTQLRTYQGFLESSTVKAALNQTGSVLAAIQILKKICDHPALLSRRALQAVRMTRLTPEQRARRGAAKAAKAKAAKAKAAKAKAAKAKAAKAKAARRLLPPPPQRKAAVLDDSDSDDFGDAGGSCHHRAGGSLTAGGFEVRVDGVLQADASAPVSVAEAADIPAGLEDDDVAESAAAGAVRLGDSSSDADVSVVGDESSGGGASLDSDSMSDFIVDDSDSDDSSSSSGEVSSDSAEESEEEAAVEWVGEDGAEPLLKKLEKRMHVGDSCKTVATLELLMVLIAAGNRTLVFSQSLGMLDVFKRALRCKGVKFLHMDGTTTAGADRHAMVTKFQSRSDIPVFLLSSKVGGLGLTLTAADRVIIVDPAWNPAVDSQSVDRAFRIGQTRHVVVYRLITCGTVEEKIYQRQVYKGALANVSMRDTNPTKYFSGRDLTDLFKITREGLRTSATALELNRRHGHERVYPAAVQAEFATVAALPHFSATSDHSLLYRSDGAGPTGPPCSGAAVRGAAAREDALHAPRTSGESRAARIGGVAAPTEPPRKTAAQIERCKLEAQQRQLQAKVAAMQSAAAATQGGVGLSDGGAKLRARMEGAAGELSAVEQALASISL